MVNLSRKNIYSFFHNIWRQLREEKLLGLSPGITFYIIMGFIPFLVFLINVLLFCTASKTGTIIKILYTYFPANIAGVIKEDVVRILAQRSSLWLWLSLLISAVSFEQALAILVRATDYKTYHGKSYWFDIVVHVKSVLFSIGLVVGIVLSLGLIVFGDIIIRYIHNYFPLPVFILSIWKFVKYILPFVSLIMMLTAFYFYAPHSYTPKIVPTMFTSTMVTVVWLAVTSIYSWLMVVIPTMGESYGPLVGLFVLFLWFRFIVYIIIFGIAFLKSWLLQKNCID